MKKKIDISGVDSLSFLGINDNNIKTIKEQIDIQIVVRGTDMQLNGSNKDIVLIESVVAEMMKTINHKGYVSPEEVKLFLDAIINEKSISNYDGIDDPVVLYTHKGTVLARTSGQKEYLLAVNQNDIVFAIGPAGTGKTYQAVAMAVSALKSRSVDRIIITRQP